MAAAVKHLQERIKAGNNSSEVQENLALYGILGSTEKRSNALSGEFPSIEWGFY